MTSRNNHIATMAAVSHPDESTETAPIEFGKQSPALLVAAGLEQATQRCREKVLRIAKECRSRNRRFRDIEFDIEEDKNDCLHSVDTAKDAKYYPADVLRVHEVFDKPRFFIGGPSSTDIAQGSCGDCWFLAALSTLSDTGLVEKICVERDEAVGVYGFIFFRDCGWVDVIIDDLLFTNSPKYEELTAREKKIYHEDKERYNRLARKGGYNLFFGQSTTENETWVPLIEKAYAKLHGDYQSLSGGFAAEAIEDLTGGVSHLIHSKDILDYEDFWSNVLQAEDRLFSCHIVQLNPERKGETPLNYVEGLCTLHAYSVLRAREVRGKRFVLLRNPWGSAQYSGPWSDGSMEWTSEWMDVLDVMGHKFGEGGQFLMEYHHFLSFFTIIEHSRLFNPSWTLTQEWVKATSRTWPCAFNHGDVSFTISVPRKTPAVIVLAKEDSRFFAAISGYSVWALDFVLYQRGRKEPQGTSQHAVYGGRSVHLEIELEAGDYVVHARLDQWLERQKDYYTTGVATWESRKLSRALAQRAASASIASNFNSSAFGDALCIAPDTYTGVNLSDLEVELYQRSAAQAREARRQRKATSAKHRATSEAAITDTPPKDSAVTEVAKPDDKPVVHTRIRCDGCDQSPITGVLYHCTHTSCHDYDLCSACHALGDVHDASHRFVEFDTPSDRQKLIDTIKEGDDNSVVIGLRVYTHKDAPVVLESQLRHGTLIPWSQKR